MSNSLGKNPARRAAPLSIRLNGDERAELQRRAGGVPVSTYVKQVVLSGDRPAARRRLPFPSVERQALGRLLGLLGSSRLSSNLNQLAKAVHTGSLPVTPETEHDLKCACADVAEMRGLLLRALGKKPPRQNVHQILSRIFEESASPEGRHQ